MFRAGALTQDEGGNELNHIFVRETDGSVAIALWGCRP